MSIWESGNTSEAASSQTASEVPITDTGEYFEGTEVETALQEAGQYITELTDNTTLVNTVATPSVSGGVFTITLTQPDGLDLEFNIDSTHLPHSSDTMSLDITAFAGTDSTPKTIYVYVINTAGSPVLTASNTSPEGIVEHVHIGNVKVGTVSASSATVYGGFSSPVDSYEIAARIWHKFFTSGAHYLSGMEITATSSNVTVGAGSMDIVFDTLSTVEKAVGTDGIFSISNAGAYTTQTDFAFTEYATGEAISSNKAYNVIIGYVWSSAGSGKLMALVQKGDMIPSGKEYKSSKEATEDKYGTLVLSPNDNLLKRLFTPVCRVVVINDVLQELPEVGTGIYAIDLRGENGGGGGSVATASNTDAGTADNDSLFWNDTLGVYEAKTPEEARAILNVEDGATADQTDVEILTAVESESGRDMIADGASLDSLLSYGVAWNEVADTYERTGALAGQPVSQTLADSLLPIQAAMRRCILNDAGEVQYYLSATDSTKREDGILAADLTGADGQVMVQIPKFYYKYGYSGTTHIWEISLTPAAGFSVHPAFIKNGKVVDYRYIGAYEGIGYDDSVSAYIDSGCVAASNWSGTTIDLANDMLGSVSGFCPMVDETRAEFRAICANRGTGWRQQDFDLISAIQLLYLIEYADWNSQLMIGEGRTALSDGTWTKDSYIGVTGKSNGDGNGTNSVGGDTNDAYMTYRGIENFFGNVWKWVDGININDNVPYICNTDTDFADDTATGYTDLGVTLPAANGYQKYLEQQPRGFLPASVGGGSSTYITDYYYQSTGWRVVALGGVASYGGYAGAAGLHAGSASSTGHASFSGRLCR